MSQLKELFAELLGDTLFIYLKLAHIDRVIKTDELWSLIRWVSSGPDSFVRVSVPLPV